MDPLFLSNESKLFGLTIFISIVFFQIIYVILQWIYIRRVDYLYYAAYMFSIIIYGLSLYKAVLNFYPFSLIHHSWYYAISLSLPLFSVLLYYGFSRSFLNLSETRPELNKTVKKLEFFLLTYILFCPFFASGIISKETWFIVFNIVCIITVVVSALIIISFLKKSIPLERFAMLGASLLVVGSIFDISFVLLTEAGKPIPMDAHLPLLICVIGELMTFTTGLAYKTQLTEKQTAGAEKLLMQEIHDKQQLQIEMLQLKSNIARELHDDLGARLSTAQLMLGQVTQKPMPSNDSASVSGAQALLKNSIRQLHGIMEELQNATLQQQGLLAACKEWIGTIEAGTQMNFTINSDTFAIRLNTEMEHHVFRMVQELINNTLKYADATIINLSFICKNGTFTLLYSDNGKGFDFEKIKRGNGIANIEHRCKILNGVANWNVKPDNGCAVSICIPVN